MLSPDSYMNSPDSKQNQEKVCFLPLPSVRLELHSSNHQFRHQRTGERSWRRTLGSGFLLILILGEIGRGKCFS